MGAIDADILDVSSAGGGPFSSGVTKARQRRSVQMRSAGLGTRTYTWEIDSCSISKAACNTTIAFSGPVWTPTGALGCLTASRSKLSTSTAYRKASAGDGTLSVKDASQLVKYHV